MPIAASHNHRSDVKVVSANDLYPHLLSPTTASGITPKIEAGNGSSICIQNWPETFHRGSITILASPVINAIGVFIGTDTFISFIGIRVLRVRPTFSPRVLESLK